MKTTAYDYHLPPERIAQTPVEPRDSSRLLIYNRADGSIAHRTFRDIVDYLHPGDILVANDSRVLPARLIGRKRTGGRAEILLLEAQKGGAWKALVGGKRIDPGMEITLLDADGNRTDIVATILAELGQAQRLVQFNQPLDEFVHQLGTMPLPPYIHTALADQSRYQTVYARPAGSAAAPTAGLHFTPDLLLTLRERGVLFETTTLHVGLDTFKPVTAETITEHEIHSEWARLSMESAERINRAKLAGGRIIAIGTTATRVLETAAWRAVGVTGSLRHVSTMESAPACPWKPVAAFEGYTDLYIHPPYQYRAVDALITNFHLPQSSLLMLIAAFAGRDEMLATYETAIEKEYRFFSFGDAMFIQ
jgi:S-adenosylmethionine:tRNA ribosyltransferase-isomerase